MPAPDTGGPPGMPVTSAERNHLPSTPWCRPAVRYPFGHSPGVGHDGQRGVGPGRGGERPAVDHKQVVDLVGPAVAVQDGRVGVVAHPGGAMLVGAVAGDAVDVDAVHLVRAGGLQDLGVAVDEPATHRQIVWVRGQGDPGDRQTPRVGHLLVEVDAVVVPGHVVYDHRHGHAVVEVLAVDALGFGTPQWTVRQAPVDREWDAHARAGDVTAAGEAAGVVVFVELEAAGADVPAAGPGVDGVVEQADGGAVLVPGDVAANQVTTVGEAVREPGRARQQQQPRGLDRAAGEDEHVGFLLGQLAVAVGVHGALRPAALVHGDLADVRVGSQVVPAGRHRVRHEHVERAGPGAGRIAVLLGERADHGGRP